MKKCTVGTRHKWNFVKNVEVRTQTLHTIRISLKGVYKCECGAKKYAEHQ